jgi:N-acetylglucosaminyldiphosphoundecaprenol N-acetyl-beta-D-mannosaminyltransferase
MHGVVEAQSDEGFRSILNSADLNVPDGMPLTWLGRFAGFGEMDRVFGPEFMLRVCAASTEHGLSHFFYGGNQGVARDLAVRLSARFPLMKVAGVFCPPFRSLTSGEKSEIIEILNHSNAEFIWIGLSTPKQERWMGEFVTELKARVAFGVGAAFDYNTGRLRRAPIFLQRAGLEWLFRMLQEPRRLFGRYFRNIPLFVCLTVRQAFSSDRPATQHDLDSPRRK